MLFLKLLPVMFSCLFMAAHFLFGRSLLLCLLSLALPVLLIFPWKWIARFFQVLLILSAAEWIRTTVLLVQKRIDAGEDWIRLAVILGAVALFTAGSALIFQSKQVHDFYNMAGSVSDPGETSATGENRNE